MSAAGPEKHALGGRWAGLLVRYAGRLMADQETTESPLSYIRFRDACLECA
jgi:hypothetical protein